MGRERLPCGGDSSCITGITENDYPDCLDNGEKMCIVAKPEGGPTIAFNVCIQTNDPNVTCTWHPRPPVNPVVCSGGIYYCGCATVDESDDWPRWHCTYEDCDCDDEPNDNSDLNISMTCL